MKEGIFERGTERGAGACLMSERVNGADHVADVAHARGA